MSVRRIHIVGHKNHGKTTLVADLIRLFSDRGLRVGSIKHTHHHHELDTPGKDSHTHRTAGAIAVGIISPDISAMFLPQADREVDKETRYLELQPMLASCDLVLVEGDSQTSAAKLEVWRAAIGGPPLAAENHSILAIVSDDQPPVEELIHLRRGELNEVADWILSLPVD